MLTDMYPSLKALASDCLREDGENRIKKVLIPENAGVELGGRITAEEEVDGLVQFWRDEWLVE